ncbi:two-component system, response regulator YesN [Bacillus sp. OV166]|uniref:response regulator transcription factor n=1 Tax=Bacillus sp. OV166 TaxID=1882763 RepID=UPI000A2AD253|nr:response regulator [Bacillus sp. OV166]SMQ63194.1 two-component system, response regulator YesN [Bacillus sp. OV166]
MRILIVDDEPLVRIGIKSSIDWQSYDMNIVGEAGDGEEAIQLMLERNPDLVLLDIKMPKKDGLEVLLEMKERGIDSKVIILSSFDDLETVKRAMKLGADDYFHKPNMNDQEILKVVSKIQKDLSIEQTEKEITYSHGSKPKEVLVKNLLLGKIDAVEQLHLKRNNISVVLFKVKNYKKILERYRDNKVDLLQNSILNLLTELLAKHKEVEFLQLEDNLFSLIFSNSEIKSKQGTYTFIYEKANNINQALKRFLNIETVYGISEPTDRLRDIKNAFQQAKHALGHGFYDANHPIFYFQKFEDVSANEQEETFIKIMKKELREENYEKFLNTLTAWEQFLQSKQKHGKDEVAKIYEGLLFMVEETYEYLGYSDKLEHIETFEELSVFYHQLFEAIFSVRGTNKNKGYSPIIKSILDYLEINYDKSISLKSLGEEFLVSPNYISRLFKKEVEKGLFDYLNEIRIQKAKSLLKDYKLKIYEIAERVGFKSQVHFAIVFQKYEGMSPKDFRKEKV